MKTNSLVFLLVLSLLLSACGGTDYVKLRIELPIKSAVDLSKYETMVVTNFLVKNEITEFDIDQEIMDYFSYEFNKSLVKDVETETVDLKTEESFESPEFWKKTFAENPGPVLLTGSVEYSEETRKAVLREDKRRFEDPFPSERKIAQRTFYTLVMEIYLVDSSDGNVLLKKEFKESRAYNNPNQTAYFAFFDLIQAVKDKMVNTLLGGERIQQRYLISK